MNIFIKDIPNKERFIAAISSQKEEEYENGGNHEFFLQIKKTFRCEKNGFGMKIKNFTSPCFEQKNLHKIFTRLAKERKI